MVPEELKEAIKESITELIDGLKQMVEIKNKLDELGVHVVAIDTGFKEFNPDLINDKSSMKDIRWATFSIPYIHLGNGIEEIADFFESACYQENKNDPERFSIIDGIKFLQLSNANSNKFEGIEEMKKNE